MDDLLGSFRRYDALCINQEDMNEKSHKVPFMRHIYLQAQQVMMWLGKEENDSQLAMSMIEVWGKAFNPLDKTLDVKAQLAARLAMIEGPFNERSWDAIRNFFDRPYWKRIWVIQEVAFEERTTSYRGILMCSEKEISQYLLFVAAFFYELLVDTEGSAVISESQRTEIKLSDCGVAIELLTLFRGGIARHKPFHKKLKYFLRRTRGRRASDPRDKVYSVLGLIDGDQPAIVPDYNKSATNVFTDVLMMHVQATRNLKSILFQDNCRLRSDRIPGLPSWVSHYLLELYSLMGIYMPTFFRALLGG